MQQEARNTETHHRLWSDSNLRHKAVCFVSAGSLESTLEQEDAHPTKSTADREEPENDNIPDKKGNDTDILFVFDSKGEGGADTGHPDPVLQLNSTDMDDTSEDEVVFTGRRNNARPILMETHRNEIQDFLDTSTAVFSQTAHIPTLDDTPRDSSPAATPTGHTESDTGRACWPPEEDIDPLADYIANIDNEYHEEVISSANPDLECGIDVEKAAMQLDLSSSTPPGSKIDSLRSFAQIQIDTGHDSTSISSPDDEDEIALSGSDGDALEEFDLLEDLIHDYPGPGRKCIRSGNPSFPSASAFADALESDPYFGFDIMDFDRPSLRRKPKGKQSIPDLVSSGSEFEIEIQEAWQNDRIKKKLRKKEREELRAQGLLGRKTGNPDLKSKYSKEMNMEELMTELRSFLLSAKNSHAAMEFLASPVLNKTARTPRYTSKTISNVDELLSGRKFNRRLFRSWGAEAPKFSQTKRGKSGAASYMDGDVVGASAPEIGAENRGRAMLEKMGWSSGTALGAADNKGILQPVAQVVKNSRAGLG
ncbi:hypothetical protein N7457_006033 [Penicillium paradoxum]|uniref:uncharacterized protein n=1 Tax=Penicillium paradoxum TaxID=176176 RepID=UPI002546939E|nr:uncharacterized protein N7457_006033 [Penicillium paradoxum]KAJ5780873.1 hypothetical protein N7457_006033 [Penicillium paradoxum]